MAFPRLITDNTAELLKEDGRVATTRPAKDDGEFFEFLRGKVWIDFNRMLDEKNVDKKINALADLYADIDEYANALGKKEMFIDGKMKDRREKMGGFENKLILEKVDKGVVKQWTEEDYEMVKRAGEEENYPAVNIGRNKDNQVYMVMNPGKEAWEQRMKYRLDNSELSQDGFMLLVEAVKRKDYVKEKIQE